MNGNSRSFRGATAGTLGSSLRAPRSNSAKPKKQKQNQKRRRRSYLKGLKKLECWADVEEKLLAGEMTLAKIAKYIQGECGERPDVKERSLTSMLSNARRELEEAKIIEGHDPGFVEAAKARVLKGLDEIDEIQRLYLMQYGRLERVTEQELEDGRFRRSLGVEVKAASDLLQRSHDMKLDLGINGKRELGRLEIDTVTSETVGKKYGDPARRAFDDPESRGKVLSIFNKLRKTVRLDNDSESTGKAKISS